MFKKKLKVVNGFEVRPIKGKCPRCGSKEKQYCKDSCKTLDPLHMAIE